MVEFFFLLAESAATTSAFVCEGIIYVQCGHGVIRE